MAKKTKGFRTSRSNFNIALLSFLVLVLAVVLGLINQPTNLKPKASQPETSSVPIQSDYYLEKIWDGPTLTTNTDYRFQALLKRKNGTVVINQGNFEYQWSNDYPAQVDLSLTPEAVCTNKIKAPCPYDHLLVRASTIGSQTSTNIRARVVDKSSGAIIASAEFSLELLRPDIYYTFDIISPKGGEAYKVGQKVMLRWSAPSKPVDYYNLYYFYYKDGQEKGAYIGSSTGEALSYEWVIPAELKGQKVKVGIQANRSSVFVTRITPNYFSVR